MKYFTGILFTVILFSSLNSNCQKKSSFNFFIGTKIKITPVYIWDNKNSYYNYKSNVRAFPDEHLSGKGDVTFGVEKKIKNSPYAIAFYQGIRRDILYYATSLNVSIDSIVPVKKWTTDFYIDGLRYFNLKHAKLYMGLGFALCDINSGFKETRQYNIGNNQTYTETKKRNTVFTAGNISAGWRKKRFNIEIKINYVWKNPEDVETFFLPEIKFQYQLFSF